MSNVNDSTQWSYYDHVPHKNSKVDMEYDYSTRHEITEPTKKINRKRINLIVLGILSCVFLVVGGGCTVLLAESVSAYLPS